MASEDVDKLYVPQSANGENGAIRPLPLHIACMVSATGTLPTGLPSMDSGESRARTVVPAMLHYVDGNLASKLPAGIGYDWIWHVVSERYLGNQFFPQVAISLSVTVFPKACCTLQSRSSVLAMVMC